MILEIKISDFVPLSQLVGNAHWNDCVSINLDCGSIHDRLLTLDFGSDIYFYMYVTDLSAALQRDRDTYFC